MDCNVILSKEEYLNFRSLLKQNNIAFESAGCGKDIYVAFSKLKEKEIQLVNSLLMQI